MSFRKFYKEFDRKDDIIREISGLNHTVFCEMFKNCKDELIRATWDDIFDIHIDQDVLFKWTDEYGRRCLVYNYGEDGSSSKIVILESRTNNTSSVFLSCAEPNLDASSNEAYIFYHLKFLMEGFETQIQYGSGFPIRK